MVELDMEHVLIIIIVVFMLYHLSGCRCFDNGFSVGGIITPPKTSEIPFDINKPCYMNNKKYTIDEDIMKHISSENCKKMMDFFECNIKFWQSLYVDVALNCNTITPLKTSEIPFDIKPCYMNNKKYTIDEDINCKKMMDFFECNIKFWQNLYVDVALNCDIYL